VAAPDEEADPSVYMPPERQRDAAPGWKLTLWLMPSGSVARIAKSRPAGERPASTTIG
jgi:hypothetical protein